MRRISSYIPLIAALATICMAGQSVAAGAAIAAGTPTVDKAALNKAVQEALAKAQAGQGGAAGAGAAGVPGAAGAGVTGAGAAGATGAGAAGGGLGSSESFSNLTKGSEEETPTISTPTTATASASSGISMSVLLPIFIVGGVLLAGIAFFIVRDARSMAPAGDGLGSAGSAQERAVRQRKRRAQAKAARRQRKRNR
jgi:hypothetical protein